MSEINKNRPKIITYSREKVTPEEETFCPDCGHSYDDNINDEDFEILKDWLKINEEDIRDDIADFGALKPLLKYLKGTNLC